MIVTEQEASEKRCQESFGTGQLTRDGATVPGAAIGGSSSFHAGASQAVVTSPAFCIGSRCMAWQWRGWRGQHRHIFSDEREGTEHVGGCGKARDVT